MSTGERVIFLLTITVCVCLVAIVVSMLVARFLGITPDRETALAVLNLINVMMGLIGGFIAGRAGNKKEDA